MSTTAIQQYIQAPKNLLALLSRFRVVIPGIQRHYVQGAKSTKSESIRKQFVRKLLEVIHHESGSLNLHFIYGPIDTDGEDSFVPVDGQQRLTTLWLLARYAVERIEEPLTREKILQLLSRFTYEDRMHAKRFCQVLTSREAHWDIKKDPNPEILRCPWFLDYWKEDETVASMIRTLSTIHQEWLETPELTGDIVLEGLASRISFELKVDSFGDDIYMKMNARGLQLTQWENFKSKFSEKLCDNKDAWNSEIEKLSNIFFEKSAERHELPDNVFFALFARIMAYESKEKCGENIKRLAEFTHKTWQYVELPFVPYSEFRDIISAGFETKSVAETCSVLIEAILENYDKKVPYFGDRDLWDTLFHPQNNNEIDFTFCCYEYFKAFKVVKNGDFLKAARLMWNILGNVDRDSNNKYNRVSIIKKFISLEVPSLYAPNAVNLFNKNDAGQALEEAEKSVKIADQSRPSDWDKNKLGEWVNWNGAIEKAEELAFFNGTIRFLYRNEDGVTTWENFAKKLINCTELFTKDGLKDDKKVRTNQVLISHCSKWEDIRRKPVFGSDKISWKQILTSLSPLCVNKMLIDPEHTNENNKDEVLQKLVYYNDVWDALIVKTEGYELEWKANAPSLWLNRYLYCTLKLRRNNREDILDAFCNNPNITFEKSLDRDPFLCINGENHYYAIPIFFKYNYKGEEYRFAWQTWGWVDMYDKNHRLYDLYYSEYQKGFNIKIKEDGDLNYYMQEIGKCIEEYKDFCSTVLKKSNIN